MTFIVATFLLGVVCPTYHMTIEVSVLLMLRFNSIRIFISLFADIYYIPYFYDRYFYRFFPSFRVFPFVPSVLALSLD